MRAIHFDPATFNLTLIKIGDPPAPKPDEVILRVVYSGVCGTDLHIAQGDYPVKAAGVILGHEYSGVVTAVGTNVEHIKVGDNVVVDPNSACHTCNYCTSGAYNLCNTTGIKENIGTFRDGGWCDYTVAPAAQTHKLPDSISLEQGALCEPLSCLAHGWDRVSPLTVGKTILIQGAGIIGLLWASILHLQGHKRVTVTEPLTSRRSIFEKLNTGYRCVSPIELTNYEADLIIDCSGAGAAIENAISLLAPGGKLCLFGVAPPKTKVSLSPYELYKKEVTIVAVTVNPFSFPKALGLIEAMGERYLAYDKLGVKIYRLEDYKEALDALKTGSIGKAMFKINQ